MCPRLGKRNLDINGDERGGFLINQFNGMLCSNWAGQAEDGPKMTPS